MNVSVTVISYLVPFKVKIEMTNPPKTNVSLLARPLALSSTISVVSPSLFPGYCPMFQSHQILERSPETLFTNLCISSDRFSHSVMSNSLWPHGMQHTRLPCPSPTLGAFSNSCPSSWWCHLAISSSVIPFSSCPQSFPASESFLMSQLFPSVGQSVRVSASASVLPMSIQDQSFRMYWLDLLAIQGTLKSLFQTHSSKASILWHSDFFIVQLLHPHLTTVKP